MTDPQLPSNSHKSRGEPPPEKKNVQRVVLGEVKQRKKPLGKRFTEMFFGGGDARTVWGYVTYEVLIPGAKDIFLDIVREGSERLVMGESIRGRRRSGSYGGLPGQSHINYQGISGGSTRRVDPRERPVLSHTARTRHDFGEIVIESRAQAVEVLERLFDLVSQFEVATVSDLYDLVGISSSYQDNKWGWENLQGSKVTRSRGGGYLLDLPNPVPLD